MSLGYSAILLPQLKPYMDRQEDKNEAHYRPFTLDEEAGSWVASVFALGAVVGGFAAGILGSR